MRRTSARCRSISRASLSFSRTSPIDFLALAKFDSLKRTGTNFKLQIMSLQFTLVIFILFYLYFGTHKSNLWRREKVEMTEKVPSKKKFERKKGSMKAAS